jgi:hypothetical protein
VLNLSDGQYGEVMGWSNSTVTVTGSNLTGAGGFYAAFDTSRMTVADSLVNSRVTAYGNSTISIENSSVVDAGSSSLLAVWGATLRLVNDTLGAGAGMEADQNGRILVASALTVSATLPEGGGPAVGATVVARWTSNGSIAAGPARAATGSVVLDILSETVNASSAVWSGPVEIQATDGFDAGAAAGTVHLASFWSVGLLPLIVSTVPPDGASGVSLTANLTIDFGFSMAAAPTGEAVGLEPSMPFDLAWSIDNTTLTVRPLPAWQGSVDYTLSVGPSARTAGGIALPSSFSATFRTVPTPPPVEVTGTWPANGSDNVLLEPTVRINFSVPMDPTTTLAAFSVTPPVPGAPYLRNASAIVWAPSAPLAPGTPYRIRVSASALSADGRPLAVGFALDFTTVPSNRVPTVVLWSPSNGSELSSPLTNLTVRFSVPMDPGSTTEAFSILPPVAGTVRVNGTELSWTATSPASENSTYLVRLAPSARSAAGVPLPGAFWWTFRVQRPATVPTTPPSSGSGGSPAAWEWAAAIGLGVAGWLAALGVLFATRRRRGTPPVTAWRQPPRAEPPKDRGGRARE